MGRSKTADRRRAELADLQGEIDAVEEGLARLAGSEAANVADLAHALARLRGLYARWARLGASLDGGR